MDEEWCIEFSYIWVYSRDYLDDRLLDALVGYAPHSVFQFLFYQVLIAIKKTYRS